MLACHCKIRKYFLHVAVVQSSQLAMLLTFSLSLSLSPLSSSVWQPWLRWGAVSRGGGRETDAAVERHLGRARKTASDLKEPFSWWLMFGLYVCVCVCVCVCVRSWWDSQILVCLSVLDRYQGKSRYGGTLLIDEMTDLNEFFLFSCLQWNYVFFFSFLIYDFFFN